jgi:hypothetical protein
MVEINRHNDELPVLKCQDHPVISYAQREERRVRQVFYL